ncbi:MAG TPA: DUF2007 domain-containing protein [Chloroflexota bacterium]|nr:DUF2007 domain-containing protein [Chloroflexota bacterium]
MGQDHWAQVATASSQMEAEMVRNLLTGEGIACLVQTSDAVAYLGVISPCRLLVRDADLDRATAFLRAWDEASPEIGHETEYENHDVQD